MNQPQVKKQSGQSIILIALLMVGMIAFLGLIIDGGRVYGARRLAQNAADSGVFAGARIFAKRPDNSVATKNSILAAINCYAEKNGIADTNPPGCDPNNNNVSVYWVYPDYSESAQVSGGGFGGVPDGVSGIHVRTNTKLSTFFLGVINQGLGAAGANAKIQAGSPSQSGGSPMTIYTGTVQYGNTRCSYNATDFQTSLCTLFGDRQGSGSFQWLNTAETYPNTWTPSSPACSGSGDLAAELYTPGGNIYLPGWICRGPGVAANNNVQAALDWWFAKPPSQRIWLVPVFDNTWGSGAGLKAYHVVQVAAFVPLCYNFGGGNDNCAPEVSSALQPVGAQCDASGQGNKCMVGRFVQFTTITKTDPNAGCAAASGTGVCSFELKE